MTKDNNSETGKKTIGRKECLIFALMLILVAFTFWFLTRIKHDSEIEEIHKCSEELKSAYFNFTKKFDEKPGDMWNATNKFGIDATNNGNGNNIIDSNIEKSDEPFLALQHLDLAGFFGLSKINFNGSSVTSFRQQLYETKFKKKNVGFYFSSLKNGETALIYAKIKDVNDNASIENDEAILGALSPLMARQIDEKFDDGNPNSGNIIAHNASNGENSCTENSQYLDNKKDACYLIFIVN